MLFPKLLLIIIFHGGTVRKCRLNLYSITVYKIVRKMKLKATPKTHDKTLTSSVIGLVIVCKRVCRWMVENFMLVLSNQKLN